jgi:transcriptional regulator with XRE-family HTH domain
MRSFPLRLLAARKRHHHRQVDAAAHFGVAQSSYARWELGDTSPDVRHYARLADYLGVTIGDVWTALNVAPSADPVRELLADVVSLRRSLNGDVEGPGQ